MTDAASGPGEAVRDQPDPGGTAAYAALRADAVRVLSGWVAPDTRQERLRLGYLAHLATHADGAARTGPPEHLTASCLVLDHTGGRVLLTLHRLANAWFQLGGHLEASDTSVWAAARREAREESGIDTLEPLPHPVQLDRHRLVGSFGTCREHLDLRYAAAAAEGARAGVSAESHDVRWWPVDALPAGTRTALGPLVSLARDALGLG